MRVLIAMETSGVSREAFRSRGHDAWSADLLPSVDGSPFHLQGDVFDLIEQGEPWDLAIFHPTCTFVTCSAEWAYGDGPYHQAVKPGTLTGAARREARALALADMSRVLALCPRRVRRLAMENPVGAFSRVERPAQSIQPYDFGDDASKRTCLWLRGLSPLVKDPEKRVAGRMVEWPKGSGKMVERWANQTDSGQNRLSPADDRWAERSATFPGIAAAFSRQWGDAL